MLNLHEEIIPTRQSLLGRLKDWNDQESWRVFFDTYWQLIYSAAIKAGLTDAEAQDAVQETVVCVLKSLSNNEYHPDKSSFKGWLMRLTGWRIADQVRKRQRNISAPEVRDQTSTGTGVLERVPDPVGLKLEATWDEEWEQNLMNAAIERVKRQVDSNQYQLFDLYVFKKWSVSRVARTFKVNPGKVYLAKHRITHLIKKEIASLRSKPI